MRILAIDLSHLFRANWEAKGADPGEALRATVVAVARWREGYDRVAICCDSGPSFRTRIDPGYKAGRERPPAAYYEQLRRCVERLDADACHVFRAPEMTPESGVFAEADDVIGSLACWATDEGHELDILGGDKDLLACVDDKAKCRVLRHDGSIFTAKEVREKFGVSPSKIPDLLGLGGDVSDGFKAYPGWVEEENGRQIKKPGIALATAAKLLEKFHDLAGIFAALTEFEADGSTPKIKGHVAEVLKRHGFAAGEKGLTLALLRTDLGLPFAALNDAAVVRPVKEHEGTYFEQEAEPAPVAPVAALAAREHEAVPMSTAMVRADLDPLGFQPRDLSQLERVATLAFNSRVYAQFPNAESVAMAMAEAREMGVPIGAALRNAYVVKGKLAWSASFLAARVLASGLAEVFEIVESTPTKAVLAYKKFGRPERTYEYTIEEARTAGWLRSGERGDSKWLTNPRTMLRWAAMREAARAFFPEVVSGLYTPDELRDGHVTDAEWEQST